MRLRQFYNVGYKEATYFVKDKVFHFNFIKEDKAIVRIFPLEDYKKLDPDIKLDKYKFGIIYIRGKDEFLIEEKNAAFDYIPDESNESVIYKRDLSEIEIKVKPVNKSML